MIKILTGYSDLGGSTVAFVNLCNAFNKFGIDCTLYGNHSWHLNKCKAKKLTELTLSANDIVIYHYLPIKDRLGVRKQILSSHETFVFPIKKMGVVYDALHFVSKSQMEWQGLDGVVIPNLVEKIRYTNPKNNIAGVIGSIHEIKNTKLSIERALQDGKKVYIFGECSDPTYFQSQVAPLLGPNVWYLGKFDDKEKMYNMVDSVYMSSIKETFNLVRNECKLAGIPYFGSEGSDPEVEILSEEQIVEKWKTILQN